MLDSLGRQLSFEGHYAEAHPRLNEALAILRQIDNRQALAQALSRYGFLKYLEGDHESARVSLEEGLDVAREAGDPAMIAEILDKLGQMCHSDGDLDGTVRSFQQAEVIWREIGQGHWLALALAVPTRLWLGSVSSRQRDLPLITRRVQPVRACALTPAILVGVEGLARYVTAFLQVFRQPIHTGRRGRPRLVLPAGFQFAQVVTHAATRHGIGVTRRVVPGTLASMEVVLTATATGTAITTAYSERLNATGRAHLAPLTRRGRAIARTEAALIAGMWLFGTAYNFCWPHDSLRQLAPDDTPRKWRPRTPAMAAGLTDRPWTLNDLLRFQVPLPRWVPPKRRGRPPKHPPLGAAA